MSFPSGAGSTSCRYVSCTASEPSLPWGPWHRAAGEDGARSCQVQHPCRLAGSSPRYVRGQTQPGPSAAQSGSLFLFQSRWGRERHLFRPLQCLITTQAALPPSPPPAPALSLQETALCLLPRMEAVRNQHGMHRERRERETLGGRGQSWRVS